MCSCVYVSVQGHCNRTALFPGHGRPLFELTILLFSLFQAMLQQATRDPYLQLCLPVRRFLDPDNYAADFVDDALKGVHMFFRSEPSWEIIEVLYGMGWRMRKSHVIVG